MKETGEGGAMTHLTGSFVAAVEYAIAVHAAQRRKGTDIPYIAHVRASSDRGYLIVACADKLHNARAILQDHREVKGRVWERFIGNGEKTPEMILGYYEELAEAFAERLPGQLADELRLTVGELVAESGLAADRGWVRVEGGVRRQAALGGAVGERGSG